MQFQFDQDFSPVICVTISFVALLFVFLLGQSFSKIFLFLLARRKDPKIKFKDVKYSNPARVALTGDRTVGNTLEQTAPFLISLWLCALFHSANVAAFYGWLWLAFRSVYPFCFYFGLPWLFFSTLPGYAFLVLMLAPIAGPAFSALF